MVKYDWKKVGIVVRGHWMEVFVVRQPIFNSPAFRPKNKIKSIKQAIVLLERNEKMVI